jgi:hypothetical protein
VREIDERNRVNLTMKGVTDEEKAQFPDVAPPTAPAAPAQ